jgi:hypothetical protein
MSQPFNLILALGAMTAAFAGKQIAFAQQANMKADSVNLAVSGDINGAIIHARKLLPLLKAKGWDFRGVPFALLRLRDQDHAQNPVERGPRVASFSFSSDPLFKDVAFSTSLYVHFDTKVVPGFERTTTIQGFLLVAWKNGLVEKVPVDRIRLLPVPDEPTSSRWIYPRIPGYSDKLPRLVDGISGPGTIPPSMDPRSDHR